MKKDWVIFYSDGSYVDSDTSIYDVPRRDVQIIVQRHKHVGYTMMHSSGDYFVFDPDRDGWRLTDIFGLWDYFLVVRQPVVLFGRNMDYEEFWKLHRKVIQICGKKQGWLQCEPRHSDPKFYDEIL
jgi:hypothetical protein